MSDSAIVKQLQLWIRYELSASTTRTSDEQSTLFDRLIDRFRVEIDEAPCSTLVEMKRRSTTNKGRYFEHLALLFLQHAELPSLRVRRVWLLADLPVDLRNQLHLGNGDAKQKQDVGIDLVLEQEDGQYSAVQCKYRTRSRSQRRATNVTWKQLSTFYSLCQRTGPWAHYIVFTNCRSVSRQGQQRLPQDYTIAYQRLSHTPRTTWIKLAGLPSGVRLGESMAQQTQEGEIKMNANMNSEPNLAKLSQQDLRRLRCAYFDSKKCVEMKSTEKI